MAERRMFAKTIVLSDAFLDMPLSARCLYFTLGMLADDDGFVNNPKSIMRQCGSSEDDMHILLMKKFLLAFDNGVIVIKHWRINNYLRNDRYQETKYIEEKKQLEIEENGAYSFGIPNIGIPNVGIPSIDKDRIGKDSIDKDRLNIKDENFVSKHSNKSKKTNDFDSTFNEFVSEHFSNMDTSSLYKAITEYISMRKQIKKPATPYAIKLNLDKAYDMANGRIDIMVAIFNQSTANSWQGVFELKDNTGMVAKAKYNPLVLSDDEIRNSLKDIQYEEDGSVAF